MKKKRSHSTFRALVFVMLVAGAPVVFAAGTITVQSGVFAANPDILGYNLGHFVEGSNTHDWWRYAGVNGARIFITPATLEATDDIAGWGDGVTDLSGFLSRKSALRADPLNESYINWTYFNDRYETKLFGSSSSGNRYTVNYALGKLRELDIDILAQITASASHLPITNGNDWAGKWELWQHYYAQAFYLGRHYDVTRYQMYNEPDHPNAGGLTSADWLMRLQLATDAIQAALADVNTLYSKTLEPLVYGPVTAGSTYSAAWGGTMVDNRHVDFLGQTNANFLAIHRYDYHQYNSIPSVFGSSLAALRNDVAADMAPEPRFPMSISEFNVHTGATFDTMPDTLDYPGKYTRLGAISVQLAKNFEKEFYCFKFGQGPRSGGTYPVAKNGMLYVQNGDDYEYGGATLAAEVWRLFCKALKPGGSQLDFDRDPNGDVDGLDLRVTYHPETGNYYIFSANESGSGVTMTIDTSAWNIPAGSRFLLEEVSNKRFGSGRTWNTVSADGTLFDGTDNLLHQPDNTVWLYTIPNVVLEPEEVIVASDDATVVDGINAGTNYGTTDDLFIRNDPASVDERKAAFVKFDLPYFYPPDIQLAVLSLSGKTATSSAVVQAHVYGLDDDSWSADTLTWSNAPNLLKSAPAGNLIANRVIDGQGETAFIQGQVTVSSTSVATKMVDVTAFLKGQTDGAVSFLISQDPRWDVTLPSLVAGDTQVDGFNFRSSEYGTVNYPGPQLKIVRRKDSDGDGLSDVAENTVFFSDPALADSDGDGQTDGEEVFAGTSPVDPTPGLLEPALFQFIDGSEFDAKTLGDNATMMRSNSWGTAITIATVDMIGQDGSKASDGVGHKTNIYKTWGNNLGINDANVTGTEYGNFNLGEAWVVTFDTDVYLTEIDLTSQSGDDEMTIKSSAFSDIVLADGESNDIHDLGNAFVPAGTEVSFECTGPADPAGGLRIAYLSVQAAADQNGYERWIQEQGLTGSLIWRHGDDPEFDGMDNLLEYALGGNALTNDAALLLPIIGTSEAGGTNWLDYVYRRRLDREIVGLVYAVGSTTNLVDEPATNPTFEAGSVVIDSRFESVTNRVSIDAGNEQFLQLRVTIE